MTYTPRLPAYAHQAEGLARMRGQRAFSLLMQMRTGKSKVLLDDFGEMEVAGEVRDLLIITPAGSYRNWTMDRGPGRESELRRQLDPALMERAAVATWASGHAPSQRAVADLLKVRDRPRVLNVNVEALSSVKKAREAVLEFLGAKRGAVVVIDESTAIRNVKSSRTKFIWDLRKLAPYRRTMTGLVSPKSPLDLFGQFYFLDPQILQHWSYFTFRARYAVLRDMPVGEWFQDPRTGQPTRRTTKIVATDRDGKPMFRHQEELTQRIAPYSYRKLLADCYDIPETFYLTREVELTDEQRRLYAEIRDNATAQLDDGAWVTATEPVAQILRLHQVLCGHVGDEQRQMHMIPNKRVDAVLEVLAEHDGKAIVWCHYIPLLLAIHERINKEYGEGSAALFYGGNRDTRHIDESRFLGDDRCRFMVATQGAGGRGNTWDCADLAIYASNSWDLEHRDQSEWRTLNVGKRRNVTNVDLVVPGTLDEKVIAALRSKIDVAAAIMGDGYREWLI
jgi:hypothetical protein